MEIQSRYEEMAHLEVWHIYEFLKMQWSFSFSFFNNFLDYFLNKISNVKTDAPGLSALNLMATQPLLGIPTVVC